MKKIFLSLVLLFLLSFVFKINAQVNTYTFIQSSGAYSQITGTLFDSATSGAGATSLDDVQYLNRAIGFSFTINGVSYTTYNMNTNGQIAFGTTGPGTTNYTPISGTVGYASCVAGLARDLQGNFGFTATRTLSSTTLTAVTDFTGIVVGKIIVGTGIAAGTRVSAINQGAGTVDISIAATAAGTTTLNCCSGELRSETQGAAGSRVHIIQWQRFKRFSNATLTDNFNFQIRIYETTNRIEVVYGSVIANATAIVPQVGLRGTTNADFNNRTTTTDWSASTAGGANNATMTLSSTVFPASGQTYRWTPVPILNDVGVTANVAPIGGIQQGSSPIPPKAKVKNFGTLNQSSPFAVVYKISGPVNYQDSTTTTLNSGAETTLTFPGSFNPNTVGLYNVTIYTELGTDQSRQNDTLKTSFFVFAPDYFGNDSGYFYANNLATNRPSFPVYCWKDTTGSKSILQNGVISPGNTLVGNLDDGYFILSLKNILLSMGLDTTDRHLKYNGVCYDSIFPGTNGIIGMTQDFGTYSIADFNIDGAQVAKNALLALWHDVNLGALPTSGVNRVSYKAQGNQLILTYDRVVSFAPTTDWVSYQVIIEIVTGCAGANSNFRYTFADTTNGNTSASFLANYLAQYQAATGDATTFRNYVTGFSQNGAPIAYAGFVSSANPFPASPVTQINVKRPVYNLTTGSGLAIEYGPNVANLNEITCAKNISPLKVSIALQGLQSNGNPVGATPRVRDTVTIRIREAISPYVVIQQFKVLLDSANNGIYSYGYKNLNFAWEQSHPYYLEVQHRNSVFAWSNIFSSSTDSLSYDFTTSIGQTFGNNAKLINGAAAMFTGDVVSPVDIQDGCVDLSDIIAVYNESSVFTSGPYVLADLNYDGTVDLSDIILVYNNANAFVCGIAPPVLNGVSVPKIVEHKYDYVPSTEIIILPDPYYVDKEALIKEVDKEALMKEEEKK